MTANEFDPKECAKKVVMRGYMCAGCQASGVCGVGKLWNDYKNRCYFYDICEARGDNLVLNMAVCNTHAIGVLMSTFPNFYDSVEDYVREVESYTEYESTQRLEKMHDPAHVREVRFGTGEY
jgi:hypothetical protein